MESSSRASLKTRSGSRSLADTGDDPLRSISVIPDATVDVTALVAEIEAEVARRRAAGEYPPELLARLRAELRMDADAEPPEALLTITSSRPLRSNHRFAKGIVFGKRVIRRCLAWYIQPIAQDQTRFNTAITRELRAVESRVRRMETPWHHGLHSPELSRFVHDLDGLRAEAFAAPLAAAPAGPVLVLGGSTELVSLLRDRGVDASGPDPADRTADRHPLARLDRTPRRSLAGLVLPAVLPRLAAAEVVEFLPLALGAVRHGGVVITDLPNPGHPLAPAVPSALDIGMRHWVTVETAAFLFEAAGLINVSRFEFGHQTGAAAWYGVCGLIPPRNG